MTVLVADIGGSTSRFQTIGQDYESETQVYNNDDFPDFDTLLQQQLKQKHEFQALCLAVAGPVHRRNNTATCQLTNRNWAIDTATLKKHHQLPQCFLLNDFEANAYAASDLQPDEYRELTRGNAGTGPRSFIVTGPGTGLGLCYAETLDHRLHVKATEAGHTSITTLKGWQRELFSYLQSHDIIPEWESVISGPGLERLYEFVCDAQNTECPPIRAADIARLATQDQGSPAFLCLQYFMELFGRFTNQACLNFLPATAVYIAGGIFEKLLPITGADAFLRGFDQGSLTRFLQPIAQVRLITIAYPGLRGARIYWQQCNQSPE